MSGVINIKYNGETTKGMATTAATGGNAPARVQFIGQNPHGRIDNGINHPHNHKQYANISGAQAVDIGIEIARSSRMAIITTFIAISPAPKPIFSTIESFR